MAIVSALVACGGGVDDTAAPAATSAPVESVSGDEAVRLEVLRGDTWVLVEPDDAQPSGVNTVVFDPWFTEDAPEPFVGGSSPCGYWYGTVGTDEDEGAAIRDPTYVDAGCSAATYAPASDDRLVHDATTDVLTIRSAPTGQSVDLVRLSDLGRADADDFAGAWMLDPTTSAQVVADAHTMTFGSCTWSITPGPTVRFIAAAGAAVTCVPELPLDLGARTLTRIAGSGSADAYVAGDGSQLLLFADSDAVRLTRLPT